jgi:hypothetical protein
MLRICFSLLVLSLAGGMMGCGGDHQILFHNAGVCDCDQDEAPCTHRYPYYSPNGRTPPTDSLPSPMPNMPAPKALPSGS